MNTSKVSIITRKDFECPIFGNPRDLLGNRLPTHEDVLRCCFQERFNLSCETNNKRVSFSKVAAIVANKVKCLYDKSSIPTVTEYRVVQLINAYHDSYYKLRKSYCRDKDKTTYKEKIVQFKINASSLFDIAACKCIINIECTCKKTPDACKCPLSIDCICEKEKKIPVIELRFMFMQRKYGLGKIGPLDLKETQRNKEKLKRKMRYIPQIESSASNEQQEVTLNMEDSDLKHSNRPPNISEDDDSDSEFEPEPSTSSAKPQWQMRIKLKATALNSDRYCVSDRATAAIASSVLQDIGLITESDTSHVVDKCKIRREKSLVRTGLQSKETTEIYGLYFDGRKDDTLFVEKFNTKHFRRSKKEEHYSLISEPGSNYIGHVSPSTSSASDIAISIISYISQIGLSLDKLEVIGCDGTATNTGWKNGVIRQIELHVGRPLQWSVCLLHFNELPFRHLFQHLDGVTTGPKSFSGPIGSQLTGCEKLPVVEFERIDCVIPEVDRQVLSKDQQYLLDICKAIQLGQCPEDLSKRDPGPLSHSRWLTTANRVLRLFIGVKNPSENLIQIVHFIMKSYMPTWFDIKISKHFTDGPKHVFKAIQTTRYLPEDLIKVINPVIQRNAYFAHLENLLLTMILDERYHIRELGYRRILKGRQSAKKKKIRVFVPPKINFEARDYTEIIDWQSCKLTPPPLLRNVTDEEIKLFVNQDFKPIMDFKKFPCHTQAVERCVKLVTEASSKVCGHSARDGFIRSTLVSRQNMPEFSSKAQFKVFHLE